MNKNNASPATLTAFERTFRPVEAARSDADPDCTRMTEICWLNPDVQVAVSGVMAEFLRLCSAAAPMHFLQIAQEQATDSSPAAVVTSLNDIQQSLASELVVVRSEFAAWNANHAAERQKTRAHELAADDSLRRAEAQLLSVRGRLKAAPEEQAASQKKLRDAGFSEADIGRIGVKPTQEEVKSWTAETEVLKAQIERIGRFFSNRPFYDVSILQEDDLTTLSMWQERLPKTNQLGYRAS
ncbi:MULTISPECIES: hypothetical protein [Paraburkholderia]|uniref:hypothetical protein n=1 Tax=Paraburkholderia TaxID=1822464 RepID=UPI0022542C88|nr:MULTISPECIES: hypothetical protein [Paraburkholderia]MCX4156147.1 hypothetical protein [Paraburkholderia aspalathi]MDN7165553.1 hypothetical protein [Paraburkholderia sp. SECH2]MDQ6394039.1 hypothetical protein [Paraburkholderia aspalathi]